MIQFDLVDPNALIVFWHIFIRCSIILFHLPLFGIGNIPMVAKVLLAFTISYAFYGDLSGATTAALDFSSWEMILKDVILNVFTSLIMGVIIKSIFQVFAAAGTVITLNSGMASSTFYDPTTSQTNGPYEKLINMGMIVIIMSSGALLPMLKGLYLSFEAVGIGSSLFLNISSRGLLEIFYKLFTAALLLSGPIMFVNFFIMSIMGIIAKTIPQVNVLTVSFIINISMGALVFIVSTTEFFSKGLEIYTNLLGDWYQLMTRVR